jgi:hypothetical protein
MTDPAVRAVIPAQLALDVCQAAEWDLQHGGQAIAMTLWQVPA